MATRPDPVDRGIPRTELLGSGEGQGSFRPPQRVARDRRGGERRIELTIDATSVNTGNDKRDEHLRSGDFFDTEHHPTVRFVSTSVSDPVGGRVNVQGELLAAGRRVVLELEPTVRQYADRLQVEASTTLDQRELGMTWSPLGITRTPATLTIHAHLTPDR